MNAGAWRRPIAGFWLLLLGLTGLWGIRSLVSAMPSTIVSLEESFNHGVVLAASRVTRRGFTPTPQGLALGPGQSGELEYRVRFARPLTRWSALTLQWYGGEAGVRSSADLLGPDGPQPLFTDRSVVGSRLPLPEWVSGRSEIGFRFTARNTGTGERLILDKLVLQAWDGPPPPFPHPAWVGLFWLGLVCGAAGLGRQPERILLAGGVLSLAVMLRYANLLRLALSPLDPDAQGFHRYAQALSWLGPAGFYSAAFDEREPVFLALVKGALWAFGDADLSLRLLTFGLSVGAVWLGYRLGRSVLGFWGGVAVGFFLAASVPAIIESGRGLRVELEALLFMGCAWLWLGRPGGLTLPRALLGGALGGMLLLTRFPYAPAVGLLLAAAVWWHREQRGAWGALALALILAAGLVAPHRMALAVRQGDAAYDTHRTLRWIVNQEFQGRPGFPSPAEVVRDPYTGPRIGLWEYTVRLHTPGELLWRAARGLVRTVHNLGPIGYAAEVRAISGLGLRWLDGVVGLIGAFGCALLLRSRETAWVPLAAFLGVLHILAFYDLGLPDYRFRMILQVSPLFAVAVATGCNGLLAWARARRPAAVTPRGAR